MIGRSGGLKHVCSAVQRSINMKDFESVQYGIKIVLNLSKSNEISYLSVKDANIINVLCLVISKVQDGLKLQSQD